MPAVTGTSKDIRTKQHTDHTVLHTLFSPWEISQKMWSGWSVSLSYNGNVVVVVGAQYHVGYGYDAGHVCVYSWEGTAWAQLGEEIYGKIIGGWSG